MSYSSLISFVFLVIFTNVCFCADSDSRPNSSDIAGFFGLRTCLIDPIFSPDTDRVSFVVKKTEAGKVDYLGMGIIQYTHRKSKWSFIAMIPPDRSRIYLRDSEGADIDIHVDIPLRYAFNPWAGDLINPKEKSQKIVLFVLPDENNPAVVRSLSGVLGIVELEISPRDDHVDQKSGKPGPGQ